MSKKSFFDNVTSNDIIIELKPKHDVINNSDIIKHHRGESMSNDPNIISPKYIIANNNNEDYHNENLNENEIIIPASNYNFDNIDMNGPPPISKRQMANSPPIGVKQNITNNITDNNDEQLNKSPSPVKNLIKKFNKPINKKTEHKSESITEPIQSDNIDDPIPPKVSYNLDNMDIYGAPPPSSNRKMVSSPVLGTNTTEPIKDIIRPVPIKKVAKPTVSKKIVKEEPIVVNNEEPIPAKASYNFSDIDMNAAPPPSRKLMTSSPVLSNNNKNESEKVTVEMKPYENDTENNLPPASSYNLDNMDLSKPPPSSNRKMMNSSPVMSSSNATTTSNSASNDEQGGVDSGAEEWKTKFEAMSLISASTDKNFQIRILALNSIRDKLATVSFNDPEVEDYVRIIKASLSEIQPKVQDAGLECVAQYFKFAPSNAVTDDTAVDWAKDFVPNFILKKQAKIQELLYSIYETIDDCSKLTFQLIISFRKTLKVPKAITSGYQALIACITSFGPSICNPVGLYDLFDKAMSQPHKIGFKDIFRELYKFMGLPFSEAAVQTAKIPLEFREELKKEFEKMAPSIIPLLEATKLTRRLRLNPVSKKGGAAAFSLVVEFSKMEAVNLEPKLVEAEKKANSQIADKADYINFFKDLSGDTEDSKNMKWNKKVERLNLFLDVLKGSDRHVVNGFYSDVCRLLKKQMADVNVQVQGACISCLTQMAKCTRRDFNREARTLFPILLGLLKETKPQVSKKLPECLDMMSKYCFDVDQVISDIQTSLSSVVVLVREETLNYLMRWMLIPEAKNSINKSSISLADLVMPRIFEDKENSIRNVAATCLGNLMQACGGVDSLPSHLKKLEDTDKKRGKLVRDLASTDSSEDSKADAPVSSKVVEDKPEKAAALKVNLASKVASTAAVSTSAPKKPTSSVNAPAVSKKSCGQTSVLDILDLPSSGCMPSEEALEKVSDYFTPDRQKVLVGGKFQECTAMLNEVTAQMDAGEKSVWEPLTEALIVHSLFGGAKKILAKTFTSIMQFLLKLTSSSVFEKKHAVLIFNQIIDKLAENKALSRDLFFAISTHFGPKWVFNTVQQSWKQSGYKNPAAKHITEFYMWLCDSILDFSISAFGAKWLIDSIKLDVYVNPAFDIKDATLRNQLGLVFVMILKCSGESIRGAILEGLGDKQATVEKLLNTLKPDELVPVPAVRPINGFGILSLPSQDDLLPRVDISSDLDPIIKKLTDENWRTQKDGVAEVGPVLARANQRIVAGCVSDLFTALKGPLLGNQKAVTLASLTVIMDIAKALPSGAIKNYVRTIGEWMIGFLGNNDKAIKQKAMEVINFMLKDCGLNIFIPFLVKSLGIQSARESSVELIVNQIKLDESIVEQKGSKDKRNDLSELIKPLVQCLSDKSADVRNKTEQIIEYLCANSANASSDLKDEVTRMPKALQLTVAPIIEKYCKSSQNEFTASSTSAPKVDKSKLPTKLGIKIPAGKTPAVEVASTKSSKTPAVVDDEPVMKLTDKAARLKKCIRRYNGQYEDATRPDEMDILQNSFANVVSAKICTKLFSADIQEQINGLEYLHSHHSEVSNAMIYSNLDLIFKMLASRMALPNCNPSIMLKALIYLEDCALSCQSSGDLPTDFELEIIIPCLLEKAIGHNNKQIQTKAVDVIQVFGTIVPSGKLAIYLLDSLKSKNFKVASTSLAEIENLVKNSGNSVESVFGSHCKQLVRVTKAVASTDSGVRTGALGVIAIIGESVWRYLGDDSVVDKKVRSMVEERLKRTPKPVVSKVSVEPTPVVSTKSSATASTNATPSFFVNKEPDVNYDFKPVTAPSSPLQDDNIITPPAPSPMLKLKSPVPGHTRVRSSIKAIEDADVDLNEDHVQFRKVCKLIKKTPFSNANVDLFIRCLQDIDLLLGAEDLEFDSNQSVAASIVECPTLLMDFAFQDENNIQIDLINAAINTLALFFGERSFSHCITYMGLEPVLCSLLTHFTNQKLRSTEIGKDIIAKLNGTCIRLLDNADRETSLLCLLSYATKSQGPSGLTIGRFSWKFFEYTVRCILKITKQFKEMEFSNMAHVMQECERFFSFRAPQEFSDFGLKGASNPYSVIVTVVQELYKYHPNEVDEYLTISKTDSLVKMVVSKQKAKVAEISFNASEQSTSDQKLLITAVNQDDFPKSSNTSYQRSLAQVDEMVDNKQKIDTLVLLMADCNDAHILHSVLDKLMKLYDSIPAYADTVISTRLGDSKLAILLNAIAIRKTAENVSSKFLSFQQKSSFTDITKMEYKSGQTVEIIKQKADDLQNKLADFEKEINEIRVLKNIDENALNNRINRTPLRSPGSSAKLLERPSSPINELEKAPSINNAIRFSHFPTKLQVSIETQSQSSSPNLSPLSAVITKPAISAPSTQTAAATNSRLEALRSRLNANKK